ncbi:MAG TPA: ABC transporter ATP-binding protein [Micromonosporaceae bacterium]
MSAPAVAIDRLTKRYGSLTAVDDLTLTVAPGEVVGFLGPNGAGKTTTIRTLLGFLRPTSGSCAVLGSWPGRDVAVRRRIGYLPGDFRVEPAMTAHHLFAWYARLRGVGLDRARELCERLDLDPTRRFGTLSKGNRQKVGLVQAFLHDPDVLVLDEPTTGLDPVVQREFLAMVDEAARRGAAVLFSSHVLPEVERVADRIAIIRGGRLVTMSTVDDLLDQARHRLELRYAAPVPDGLLDGVPGVVRADVDGYRLTVVVDGPVGPVLRAAASRDGLVRIDTVGDELEDLFLAEVR